MKKDLDFYSPYKAARHEDRLKRLRNNELMSPVFIQWDLTNVCNLRCNFCFYRIHPLSDFEKKDSMTKETVFRVLGELKDMGVKAIEWTGGGEPTIYKDFNDTIREANRLGFVQSLVTNGTTLDEEKMNLIKDFEWVRFSIDSVKKHTYSKIKGKDLFYYAIKNMRNFIKIKDKNNIVGFSFVVCRDNYKEIYDAAILAKELGCQNIRFSLAMTKDKEGMFDGIWESCLKQFEKAKKLQDDNFRVFHFSNRIYELDGTLRSDYCGYHHFVSVIAPAGVYPCCRLKDDDKYNFGNLNERSFKEIWFGEKRMKFIKSIEEGCPFDCWMTEKNKFIHYLVSDNPPHVNFV